MGATSFFARRRLAARRVALGAGMASLAIAYLLWRAYQPHQVSFRVDGQGCEPRIFTRGDLVGSQQQALPWHSATFSFERGDNVYVHATADWPGKCSLSCQVISDGVPLVTVAGEGEVSCDATVPF